MHLHLMDSLQISVKLSYCLSLLISTTPILTYIKICLEHTFSLYVSNQEKNIGVHPDNSEVNIKEVLLCSSERICTVCISLVNDLPGIRMILILMILYL